MSEIIYKKAVPTEVIEVGDIIQIDLSTGKVQKSILPDLFDMEINSKLMLGVCIESDNTTPLNIVLNGGTGKELKREVLDGGLSDNTQTIILYNTNSSPNTREQITVAYSGQYIVNMDSNFKENDLICISKTPGKGKKLEFIDARMRNGIRTIGRVASIIEENKKALINLDIE